MQDVAEIFINTFTPTIPKVVAALGLLVTFLFGDIYHDAIIALLMLMAFDTILGIAATVSEGQSITSRRFSRVLYKGIVYMMSISAGYFLDLTLPFDLAQATMVGFVATTEFISILENMGRLGYETPKKLLNQLKDFRSSK